MSRKRILNITTKKKHDTMIAYGNLASDSTDGTATWHLGQQILKGGRTYIIPWIATARDLTAFPSGNTNISANVAARTATTCYMRGLKERIQVQTNNGTPWQWRRICFKMKGDGVYRLQDADTQRMWRETSSGWMRAVTDFGRAGTTSAQNINILLFQGAQGTDWSSYFTAKTSSERVSVCYDKTRIISSGNASGVMRNYNEWHPMNRNLVYDDDESGAEETTEPVSTDGNQGMGDYYVVDYISAGTGGSTTDLLSFEPQATLYWHEK